MNTARTNLEQNITPHAAARYWRATTPGTTQAPRRRACLRVTGLKPRELAAALRLKRFKALMRSGKNITDSLYETGYGSSSRVYERSNAQLGMTPATYRKGGQGM